MKKLIAFVLGLFIALPSMAANLPAGYTELEYIESTGTQYIDTGVAGNAYTDVNMRVKLGTISGGFLFGTDTLGNGNRGIQASSDKLFLSYGGQEFGGSKIYSNVIYDLKTHYQSGQSTITLDNSLYVTNASTAGIVSNNNLFLFARNSTGNVGAQSMTLYSAQIYNGSLVRNFIPAKNSSNVIGMYDTVGGKFYENAGNGKFTAGPEIDPCKNLFDDELLLNATGWTKTDGIYSGGNVALYEKYGASTDGFPLQYKANTQYTLSYTIVTSGSVNNARFRIYYTDNTYGDGPLSGIVTTPTTYTLTSASGKSISKIIYNYTNGSGNISLKDIQLEQSSTATTYTPYDASCGVSANCNLFDESNLKNAYWTTEPSSLSPGQQYYRVASLDLPAGTYTFSTNYNDTRILRIWVNGQKTEFPPLADNKYTFTVTQPGLVSVNFRGPTTTSELPSNLHVKFERGSTVTPYRAYDAACLDAGCHNYTTATGTSTQASTPTPENPVPIVDYTQGNIVLRAVGDYKDSYDASTGIITRRVGVKVLNGTENMTLRQTASGIATMMWSSNDGCPRYYGANNISLMCSSLPFKRVVDGGVATSGTPIGVYVYYDASQATTKAIYFNVDATDFPTESNFKSWLAQQYAAGTPVTIYYPLAEPTTEYVGMEWCEGIKIATTKYNTNAFSGVVTALSNAVDTIKTVVANTITQATAVANLHSGKQTKPTDTCPNGKICLLVEDEAGTPHWYEIIERAPGIVPAGSGYTQVEYLQSSGTQYIDTGVTDPVMKWDIVAQRTDESGGQMLLWGYGPSLGLYISNMETGGWNIRTSQLYRSKMDKVKLTHDRITGNVVDFYIDDVLKDHVTGCSNASGSAYLFRANNAANNMWFTGRVYSAQAYKDGSLVRDFVPARRNSDGVLGMYDTVSGNFFTNAGSGEFTAPGYLPSGYTQLQYIKASGTQYIDTGVVMSNDVEFTANVGTVAANVLGIKAGVGLVVWQGGNVFNFRYRVNSSGPEYTQTTSIPYALNTMYNVGYNINKSSFSVDGRSIAKERDIYNTGDKIRTGASDITASLKIWNNGVLVRDFVPVQRNSDGVLGLYNLLDTNPSTAFYTNQGTGTFTAGAPVQ